MQTDQPQPSMAVPSRFPRLEWGLLALFLVFTTRRAWLCDDAYITFRTVDNFIHGYGLTWNVTERVQAYTHPLWMFLVSGVYTVTHEIFFTVIFLSLLISLLTAWLCLRVIRSRSSAVLCLLILTLSSTYIDYASSGLENALSHLILVCFAWLYFRPGGGKWWTFWLALLAAAAGVNRLDLLLLYIPALLVVYWQERSGRTLLKMAVGLLPILVWEIFSLLYYGFPFPNTFFAKLHNGLPAWELIRQGGWYLLNALHSDPLMSVSILCGLATGFSMRRRKHSALAVGMLVYLLYLLRIGGDFMSGRMLTPVFLSAVLLLGQSDLGGWRPWLRRAAFGVVILLGLVAPVPVFLVYGYAGRSVPGWLLIDTHGIADERQFYQPSSGLMSTLDGQSMPNTPWRQQGLEARQAAQQQPGKMVVEANNIGVFGYYAGPQVYIVDRYALADALLAHLPPMATPGWRIGHLTHRVPVGYLETVRTGENHLADPKLAAYYQDLLVLIQGPLFAPGRLQTIWKMNTGQYEALIDRSYYSQPDLLYTQIKSIGPGPQPIQFESGVSIRLDGVTHAARVNMQLSANDDYQVEFLRAGARLGYLKVKASSKDGNLRKVELMVPGQVASSGYDELRVYALRGDWIFRVGDVVVDAPNQGNDP